MNNIIQLLFIAGVIGFQTLSGYIGNKYMGAILPVIFSGFQWFSCFYRFDRSFKSNI